ncbi:hypothetical protein WMY93_034176 [Mugilogobius chulae]|uniref:Uncharacterized protein n=1 Tax=Mugilogobius chulae TaxID=88201 RepID=A0AAW0MG46_9GOBI
MNFLLEEACRPHFALRRQEIVTGDKPVKDLLTRWPALHMESQVFAEFHRITNVNLRNTFYAELDRHTQTLIGLYRQKASRTGKISEALQKILREYDLQEQDVILKRTLSLRALSVYLKEEDSDFYLTCNEDGEQDASNCPLALQSSAPDMFGPGNISVIVEGNVFMNGSEKSNGNGENKSAGDEKGARRGKEARQEGVCDWLPTGHFLLYSNIHRPP